MIFRTKIFLEPTRSSQRLAKPLINQMLLLLKQSKSTKLVQQIHTQILVHSIQMPMPNYLLSKIIELKDLGYSELLFPRVPVNSYAFNVMIRGLATTWEKFDLALELFVKMKSLGVRPDNFTYPFVFMSFGSLEASGMAKSVHSEVLKSGLLVDFHVVHSLITMYSKFREMGFARKVFDEMSDRDLVSWNSIISGYSRAGFAREAMEMFGKMREGGILEPDEMTLVSVLAACGDLGDLSLGRSIEEQVREKGMELNSYIGSALINMYGKCGELESARKVFDGMKSNDIVIWNAMITGYAQNGKSDETLSLFNVMKETGPEPNEITLIEVLSICASNGALDLGMWIDEYASRRGFHHNIYVGTALVDMYAKCGNLEYASRVFENMPKRNEAFWNSMISAYAFHGKAKEALSLFQRMLKEKRLCPDEITFIKVLSACVHAGLVDEGRRLFNLMSSFFGLTPKVEHYSCMVDLLSRAGQVYEAWDFIQKMPQKPDEILLGPLLVACQRLKNVDIGERVSQLLLEMEPSNSGNYIISSNIYANVRRWEDSARVRALMKQNGVTKTPGCSWIEMEGHPREFHAGDLLMENAEEIQQVLGMLYDDMEMDYQADAALSRDRAFSHWTKSMEQDFTRIHV